MKYGNLSKSERTRRHIIEKAAPVINKKGAAGTSITDLIAATDLTKGGIYGNFKNKDELILAVFDYNIESINRIFARETAKAETPGQKLAAYPNIFRKLYAQMSDFGGCPVLNTATEADDTHPVLCRKVAETITEWKKQAEELIEAGIKNGEIKPGTNPGRVAGLMLSLFEGGGILAKVTGKDDFMTDAIDQIETMIKDIISAA